MGMLANKIFIPISFMSCIHIIATDDEALSSTIYSIIILCNQLTELDLYTNHSKIMACAHTEELYNLLCHLVSERAKKNGLF